MVKMNDDAHEVWLDLVEVWIGLAAKIETTPRAWSVVVTVRWASVRKQNDDESALDKVRKIFPNRSPTKITIDAARLWGLRRIHEHEASSMLARVRPDLFCLRIIRFHDNVSLAMIMKNLILLAWNQLLCSNGIERFTAITMLSHRPFKPQNTVRILLFIRSVSLSVCRNVYYIC